MTETRVARVTGIGALACVALSWLQFPLWVIGEPPSMYDGAGFARHLFDIRTMALFRVLMDLQRVDRVCYHGALPRERRLGHARQRRAASLDGLARPHGGGFVSDLRAGDVLRSRRRGGVLQRRGPGASHRRELPPVDLVLGRRGRADPPRSRRRENFGRSAAAPVGVIAPERRW